MPPRLAFFPPLLPFTILAVVANLELEEKNRPLLLALPKKNSTAAPAPEARFSSRFDARHAAPRPFPASKTRGRGRVRARGCFVKKAKVGQSIRIGAFVCVPSWRALSFATPRDSQPRPEGGERPREGLLQPALRGD